MHHRASDCGRWDDRYYAHDYVHVYGRESGYASDCDRDCICHLLRDDEHGDGRDHGRDGGDRAHYHDDDEDGRH